MEEILLEFVNTLDSSFKKLQEEACRLKVSVALSILSISEWETRFSTNPQ